MKKCRPAAAAVLGLVALAAPGMAPLPQKKSDSDWHTPQQAAPSGLILGRVVDATTSQPLANARVVLGGSFGARGQAAPTPNVLTSDAGYFLFRDLPSGSYSLTASASGYLEGSFGQRRPGGPGQPFSIVDGQRAAGLEIRLWREATLSGAISDEAGDPIAGLAVSLLRLMLEQTAGSSARPSAMQSAAATWTDAQGIFRFQGLFPGEYIVSVPSRMTQLPVASANLDAAAREAFRTAGSSALAGGLRVLGAMVRLGDTLVQTSAEGSWGGSNTFAAQLPMTMRADGAVSAYPATFFPGTPVFAQATSIKLASGEDRHGLNLQLKSMPLGRVTGRLIGPGGPVSGHVVHLIPAFAANSSLERTHETAVTVSGADGAFSFIAVPPGEFVIKAWRLPPSLVIGGDAIPAEPTLWARVPVTVGSGPPTPVAVTLSPGSAIRGRLVFSGAAPPQPLGRFQTVLSVAFEPAAAWSLAFGARLSTRVGPNYDFVTQALPPGEYFPVLPNQFTPPAAGWFFESATREGRDLMISPLVLGTGSDAGDVIITFSDKRTTLSGTVQDASGRPSAAAAVVVFPVDTRAWIEHGLSPGASWSGPVSPAGAFTFDVRPGEYFVAAIDENRLENWRQAATVTALAAQAARITIASGESARRDLRVVTVRTP